jgi:excisionase family DNA binding protein
MEEALQGLMTTKQANARVGLTVSQIRRLLEAGKVKGVKIGRDWLVEAGSLDHYVAHCGRPGARGSRSGKVKREK